MAADLLPFYIEGAVFIALAITFAGVVIEALRRERLGALAAESAAVDEPPIHRTTAPAAAAVQVKGGPVIVRVAPAPVATASANVTLPSAPASVPASAAGEEKQLLAPALNTITVTIPTPLLAPTPTAGTGSFGTGGMALDGVNNMHSPTHNTQPQPISGGGAGGGGGGGGSGGSASGGGAPVSPHSQLSPLPHNSIPKSPHAPHVARAVTNGSRPLATAPQPHVRRGKSTEHRDFPYWVRRISVGNAVVYLVLAVDPHGAYGIYDPPINDLIASVGILFGLILFGFWTWYNVSVLFGFMNSSVPRGLVGALYFVPIAGWLWMAIGLVLEWVYDRQWYIGVYNIGFAWSAASFLTLVTAAYFALRRLLNDFLRTTRLRDMSHIHKSLRTLRVFILTVVPAGLSVCAFLVYRAWYHFTTSLPNELPRQPPPTSISDELSTVFIYAASYVLIGSVVWFVGFPRTPKQRATVAPAAGAIVSTADDAVSSPVSPHGSTALPSTR